MGGDVSKITVQTDDEILETLIYNEVILQEAKKQKLTADYSDAKKQQEEYFETIVAYIRTRARFER